MPATANSLFTMLTLWHRYPYFPLVFGIIVILSILPAGAEVARVEKTPGWGRLTRLWQTMLAHSQGEIYSASHLNDLAKDIEAADTDLADLVKKHILSQQVSDTLRWVIHDRYEYLQQHHYTTASQIKLNATESAALAAHWLIELELAVLRRASKGSEVDLETAALTKKVLKEQLTYLQYLNKLEDEFLRRRIQLAEKERNKEKVDWKAFENECAGKRIAFLDAYHRKKLRPTRQLREAFPYILLLTEANDSTVESPAIQPVGGPKQP